MKALKAVFAGFLRKYRTKKLAIVTHREADLDAISSCFALSSIFKKSDILLIDNPDDEGHLLIEKLGIKTRLLSEVSEADKKDYAGIVLVDTSTSVLVPGIMPGLGSHEGSEGSGIICIIDHHRKIGKDLSAPFEIIDENSPSTAEIIANMLSKIGQKEAFALSVGIIADTAQFNSGRIETFETLGRIMRISGASYAELLFYAGPPKSLDKKIAIAKAVQKMEFVEHKGFLICTCLSGGSESDVASMLASELDIAFAAKKDSKDPAYTRISGRVNRNSDIHLNEIMMKVGALLNGKGGGHHKAAGARVMAKREDALKTCVAVAIEWIDARKP